MSTRGASSGCPGRQSGFALVFPAAKVLSSRRHYCGGNGLKKLHANHMFKYHSQTCQGEVGKGCSQPLGQAASWFDAVNGRAQGALVLVYMLCSAVRVKLQAHERAFVTLGIQRCQEALCKPNPWVSAFEPSVPLCLESGDIKAQVFAAVTGYFVLGEVLTLPQIVGGAVTLSAVFLISGSKQKKAEEGKELQSGSK
eukprot:scaffold238411_cov17-Tisochrysis_lutea.AAC.1